MSDTKDLLRPTAPESRPAPGTIRSVTQRLYLRLAVGYLFHKYFNVVPACSTSLREQVYRIRYEVYCRELAWEDPKRFPDRMEFDEYDADSLHVLVRHRPSNTFAGCVRLVRVSTRDPGKPLPFELSCENTLYPQAHELLAARRHEIGEISRLAVPAGFRRRVGETAPVGDDSSFPRPHSGPNKRRLPPIATSLYVAAACSGLVTGLEGVFALMEPRLAARLERHGIVFTQMGGTIEHRGLRAPFYIDREGLFRGIDPKLRALLDVITGDLRKGLRSARRSGTS